MGISCFTYSNNIAPVQYLLCNYRLIPREKSVIMPIQACGPLCASCKIVAYSRQHQAIFPNQFSVISLALFRMMQMALVYHGWFSHTEQVVPVVATTPALLAVCKPLCSAVFATIAHFFSNKSLISSSKMISNQSYLLINCKQSKMIKKYFLKNWRIIIYKQYFTNVNKISLKKL